MEEVLGLIPHRVSFEFRTNVIEILFPVFPTASLNFSVQMCAHDLIPLFFTFRLLRMTLAISGVIKFLECARGSTFFLTAYVMVSLRTLHESVSSIAP